MLCGMLAVFALSGCTSSGIFLLKDHPKTDSNVRVGESFGVNDEDVNKNNVKNEFAKVKQKAGLTNIDTDADRNVFDEIKKNFRLPSLAPKRVNRQVRVFTRNPEYLQRMFNRSKKYIHFIHTEVQARNLPSELALLPFVESAYNPQATSRAKAAGLWQFIPATGLDMTLNKPGGVMREEL